MRVRSWPCGAAASGSRWQFILNDDDVHQGTGALMPKLEHRHRKWSRQTQTGQAMGTHVAESLGTTKRAIVASMVGSLWLQMHAKFLNCCGHLLKVQFSKVLWEVGRFSKP